jgi:PAS domain S-box-containing protein
MTGIYQTVKTRLLYFKVTIVLLFVLFFILQYNNYYFTRKIITYDAQVNQTILMPSKLSVLYSRFLQTDLLNDDFYATEKSPALDSLNNSIAAFKSTLDSLSNAAYLPLTTETKQRITNLHNDCDKLTSQLSALKRAIMDRGLYSTGQSGEWHRFGKYLEEMAAFNNNVALNRSIAALNRNINEYQLNKSNEKLQELLDRINGLKASLSIKSGAYSIGLADPVRTKMVKELESFTALTLAIEKTDVKVGMSGDAGVIGQTGLSIKIIGDKASDVNSNIKSDIHHRTLLSLLIKTLLILMLAFYYLWFISKYTNAIYQSLHQIKQFASELMLGKEPTALTLATSSELHEISELFNNFVANLREKIRFASKLESGQTGASLKPLSEEDTLANALLDMEKSLQKASEEDNKYKIAEQKRTWANEGLAKFSEILRMQTDNLAALSDEIIVHVVKYLKANQGGIFLFNDHLETDRHLELISAFAYDRKKFLTKRIEIGEGLVGTCAQEQQTIFLTDIPEDYIEINSGLGDAPPRSILIVPLKTEKNIYGILEIASFNIIQPFEIEFVEKLAQSIASTFATVKININTNELLEQSKSQGEEMAQQEEEMRQNLEELQATQEESARREAEINSLANAVETSTLVIQTDMDGRVIEVNNKFCSVVKMHRDELIGRYLKGIFQFKPETDEFYNLLQELKKGEIISRNEETNAENHQAFLQVNYSPILDRDGKPYKVLGIATNVTSHRLLEQTIIEKDEEISEIEFSYNQYKSILKEGFIVCELTSDGAITDTNDYYSEITGYLRDELINKDYRKFLRPDEMKTFEIIWGEVLKNKTYKGVIKRTKPTGDESWLMTSFIPYKNRQGKIFRIVMLAQDVTEKKLKYQVLEEANKEIDRLKAMQNPA